MSTPETVRVRVAVMINGKGEWNAEGWYEGQTERIIEELRHTFIDCERLDEHTVVRFIEADVPVPTAETLEGIVVSAAVDGRAG